MRYDSAIGKDTQDAVKTKIIESDFEFESAEVGTTSTEIINNPFANLVKNSYGKNPCLFDKKHYYENCLDSS